MVAYSGYEKAGGLGIRTDIRMVDSMDSLQVY